MELQKGNNDTQASSGLRNTQIYLTFGLPWKREKRERKEREKREKRERKEREKREKREKRERKENVR